MMRLLIVILIALSFNLHAQKEYVYYVYTSGIEKAHQFSLKNGAHKYTGTDTQAEQFFSTYTFTEFKQAFPEYENYPDILNVLYVKTYNENFIKDLLQKYPNIYLKYDDLTDEKIELLTDPPYYPNDYGQTSPVANLGADVDRSELDYLNAPEAWGITTGDASVKIGISDTRVCKECPDFNGKITYAAWASSYEGPSHGTDVAALAAARGDNASGSVGVCMDCEVVSTSMSYWKLRSLAESGVKVINMSWGWYYPSFESGYYEVRQNIFNALTEEFGVVFVGAAGNRTSNDSEECHLSYGGPYGTKYVFPASYDNVISVSTVNYENPYIIPMTEVLDSYIGTHSFPIHLGIQDGFGRWTNGTDPMRPVGAPAHGGYVNANNTCGLSWEHTSNDRVDILATGYNIFLYSQLLNDSDDLDGSGTSFSAPLVSGTLGLMFSVFDCMTPTEAKSILQLASKDVVYGTPLNEFYQDVIGSGKLEIGDSVKFVDQMIAPDGQAELKNHLFKRFDFKLERINHNLSLTNYAFTERSTADFTAKNRIEVLEGCHFEPNEEGFVHLKLNADINVACAAESGTTTRKVSKKKPLKQSKDIQLKVIPNPNDGLFTLYTQNNFNLKVSIYDVNGRLIHQIEDSMHDNQVKLDIRNYNSGVYFINASNNDLNETLKVIKK